MNEQHIIKVSEELGIEGRQVAATAGLFGEGATVPFIARYRKEVTGSLDEVAITGIRDRLIQLEDLEKRREAILKSLEERELLTDELKEAILAAETLAVLEDIYLPFRPKRRTRATVAKETDLEPLAEMLWAQDTGEPVEPVSVAEKFIDEEKGVESAEDALAGARDIMAEWANEDGEARAAMRDLFQSKGVIESSVAKGKEEEGAKYRDYFEWEEPVGRTPSHRLLAMLRGERESFLSLHIAPPEEEALALLESKFVKGDTPASGQVKEAVHDSYKRLLAPSMENEIRGDAKSKADETAIKVFARNLRELLLAPPLGRKNVLAIDPGYRTGCKVACLDRQGKLLHDDVIYVTRSEREAADAERKVKELCERFEIESIAIGNGTASRETEVFIRKMDLPSSIVVVVVNESGASVYSASQAAREEFPDRDVTVRGTVSIGRRLMDPLAELVKIDPKSIGVGQYQHDVDQNALRQSLDDVVVSCVNGVGVEVNTASSRLLTYVSGLGPQLAGNIVRHREEKGPFRSRDDLRDVPRLGPKAFEQSAGFLRIHGGENPLDSSAVHPESYVIVLAMANDMGCSVSDMMRDETVRTRIKLESYVTEKAGMPTLTDIMEELARPGRDPRKKFEPFGFDEDVTQMEDLKTGMKLPGIITNVTAFGAFVDIGVHQEGLIHVSQLADQYVKDPAEVVKVGQKVNVRVVEVDLQRRRIALSLRAEPSATPSERRGGKSREETRREPRRREGKKPERAIQAQGAKKAEQRKERGIKEQPNWFTDALRQAEQEKKSKASKRRKERE